MYQEQVRLSQILGAFRDLNNQYMLNGTSASGKLNIQYASLTATEELAVKVLGNVTSFFFLLGIFLTNF